jgi:outer membrane protein assembly factor BamB
MKKLNILTIGLLVISFLLISSKNSSAADECIIKTNVMNNAMFLYSNNFLVMYEENNEVNLMNAITNQKIDSYSKTPLAVEYSNFIKRNNIFEDNKPKFIGNFMFYVDKTGMSCFDFPTGKLLWKNDKLYDRGVPNFISDNKLYLDLDSWNYMWNKLDFKIVDLSTGSILEEFVPNIRKIAYFAKIVAMYENDLIVFNEPYFYRYDITNRKSKWESEVFVGTKLESVKIAEGKLMFISDNEFYSECLPQAPMIRIVDLNDGKTVNEYFCDKFVEDNGFIYSSYCLYCDKKNRKISKFDIKANKIVYQKNMSEFSNNCFIENNLCNWNDLLVLPSLEDDNKHIKLSMIGKNDFVLKQSIMFENQHLYSINQEKGIFFITTHNTKLVKPQLHIYFEKSFYYMIVKDYIRMVLGLIL